MQRRLEEEGTSFRQVKDEVRREMMVYYITRTKLDFIAISERLGFAEQAVMSRLCQKLFATTPTAMRALAARDADAAFVAADQAKEPSFREKGA
jgi:AraC-like DNA-binding protein